jgi:hypothetical protein
MLEIWIRMQGEVAEEVSRIVRDTVHDIHTPPQARCVEDDEYMQSWWIDSLRESMQEDCAALLRIVDDPEFGTGKILIPLEHADLVMRACSLIRLHIWRVKLGGVSEEILEDMIYSPGKIDLEQRASYVAYMVLAHLQEKIVQWMDGEQNLEENEETT